jgi:TatD DNase family protein
MQDILRRAKEAGLCAVVQVATDLETSQFGLELSRRRELPLSIHPTAGLYPSRAQGQWASELEGLGALLRFPEIVALGEVGIDLFHDSTYLNDQIAMLRAQVELAQQVGKPMVFHIRNAFKEVSSLLDEMGSRCPRGVWHCFEGDLEQAKSFLDRGWMISFSGLVTYKKNKILREVASYVPDEAILVETDSPYLSPAPLRRERNEPHKVSIIADFVAKLRGVDPVLFGELSAKNTRDLFQLCN